MRLRPPRPACGRTALTVVGLVLWACGPADTGILLEVTASNLQPDQLKFVIGAQTTTSQGTIFVEDTSSRKVVDVAGRDLGSDPYRLLVHDGLGGSLPMSAAVLALRGTDVIGFAGLGPTPFVPGELLLYRLELAGTTGVQLTDTGCVTWSVSGTTLRIAEPDDHDCDNYRATTQGGDGDDCNDEDPHVNPGVIEVCGNGIDDNCNDQIDESPDQDGDGVHLCDGDCDDTDPAVHPGAVEICDGKDNDCNGTCDDGLDRDGDGFTPCGTLAGLVPGPDHICGAPTSALVDCRDATASTTAPAIHPFAHEFCDGTDDNCDGTLETAEPCYTGISGPGNPCALGTRACKDDRTDGDPGLQGSCQADLSAPGIVDAALCNAYDETCKDDPEPWRCASEAAALATFDCTLSYTLALGTATAPPTATLCPDSNVPAPTLSSTAPGCAYRLLGGTAQEGYDVGLRTMATSGAPGPIYLGCDAELAVTAASNPFAPQPDEWMLAFDDPGTIAPAGVIVFHVTPARVPACPATPMSCTMRIP